MITGLIKANDEGFEDTTKKKGIEHSILTVKSDRPKKFQRQSVAFDAMNFKNPVPTAFKAQQIKENNVYRPKEFKKLNYNEDPFKVLFGYTKRINPDDNLNPKYYEFNLGNKNENSFIVENLQAENGTATNDVEQREADDRKHMATLGASPKKVNKAKKGAGGGGAIAIEPITTRRDVFKEFIDKTDIGDFKVQDGLATKGEIEEGEVVTKGYIPREEDLKDLIGGVEKYIDGTTTDRTSLIKLNKYFKAYGIEPLTRKELSYEKMEPKLVKFFEKVIKQTAKHHIADEAIKQKRKLTKIETIDRLGEHKEKLRIKAEKEAIEREKQERTGRNKAVFARLVNAFKAKKEEAIQAEERQEEEQRERNRKFKASLQRQPKRRGVSKRSAAPAAPEAAPAPAVKEKPAPVVKEKTTPVPVPAPATAPAVRATHIPKLLTYAGAAAAPPAAPPALQLALPTEPAAKEGGDTVQKKLKHQWQKSLIYRLNLNQQKVLL